MFTTGRLVFAAIFLSAFAVAMFFAYRTDARKQRNYYRGVATIFLTLLGIWLAFYAAVKWLR